ncbi:MAG: hypothetical protein ABI596_12950 [Pyrinomonadaceae bacterium]
MKLQDVPGQQISGFKIESVETGLNDPSDKKLAGKNFAGDPVVRDNHNGSFSAMSRQFGDDSPGGHLFNSCGLA